MESPTGFPQAPSSSVPQHFATELLLSVELLLQGKQDFNRFQEASPYVIFSFQRKFRLLKTAPFFPLYLTPHPQK